MPDRISLAEPNEFEWTDYEAVIEPPERSDSKVPEKRTRSPKGRFAV